MQRWPEVFRVFLALGLRCFGGPVAHLGYFRAEFVERRAWLDEAAFADLVGLCQFLPGPASSQTGFAIGFLRGGYAGGLAAWVGFTLPSAVLMVLFASGAEGIAGSAWGAGLLHGLMLAAVAVVAQAVSGMARTLCPDVRRAAIAAVAAGVALWSAAGFGQAGFGQVGAIAVGAVAGVVFCEGRAAGGGKVADAASLFRPMRGAVALGVFFGALVLSPWLGVAGAFYRAGALVFGGGHVVLPLLHDAVVSPGLVSDRAFLAGYGAAQALPGPLFAFAAYLGAVLRGPVSGVPGAVVATVAIFLPGLLLVIGVLPFWHGLRAIPSARAALMGVNAAVVGVLAAAFCTPVWTGAVFTIADAAIAVSGFGLLILARAPPLAVVALGAAAGLLMGPSG